MPAFRWISIDDMEAVVDYVILLSQRGELEAELIREVELELDEEDDLAPTTVASYAKRVGDRWNTASEKVILPETRQPPYTDESIRLGRKAFLERDCMKCHGRDGRGQTQQNVGKDDWGNTVKAADLTAGMLHGGRRPIDIYRRIHAGINGTPMPASADALKDQPETIWRLVHYITSLVDGREVDLQGIDEQVQPLSEQGEP
jgi:mono/diheme cytochrome c family protein